MRSTLLASVALFALLAGCGGSDRVLKIDDFTPSRADGAVSLVERGDVLRDAVEHDRAPLGEPIDFDNAPDAFALEFDAGEGVAEADGGSVDLGWGDYSNFAAGVLVATWAHLVTVAVVLPPAIGIAVVAQGEITEIETNVWQAERTIPLGGQDVTGVFTVAWVGIGWLAEMKLTTEDGEWTDDIWFNGFLAEDGTVGWWDLYDRGELMAVIEWTSDGGGNAEISLAAVGGEHEGSSLDYVFMSNGYARIDAVGSDGAEAWVQLNPDHSGEVSAPDYNSGARSCWDSSFVNVECLPL